MILDLFRTEISCNSYNLNITNNQNKVSIKVKCMGYDGNPVVSENVVVKHNGSDFNGNSGSTNVSGEFIITDYTLTTTGLHTFTCNGVNVQVYVAKDTHPVGSIYISVNNTNPSTLFGGTWQKIEGRFLLASNSSHPLGQTGGAETVTLTTAQMPNHTHSQTSHSHGVGSNYFLVANGNVAVNGTKRDFPSQGGSKVHLVYSDKNIDIMEWSNTSGASGSNGWTGGSASHSNMPPFLVVSVWKRTA